MKNLAAVWTAFGILAVAAAYPQELPQPAGQDQGFKISLDVKYVTVPVRVLDRRGRYVPALRAEDFTIQEDGKNQEIVEFLPYYAPVRAALVLDTSASVSDEWQDIVDVCTRFLGRLDSQDRFALFSFGDRAELKLDWDYDIPRVSRILSSIRCDGMTALWDALGLAAQSFSTAPQGKRAIVVMTDGLENSSRLSFRMLKDELVRSEAILYVISELEAARRRRGCEKRSLERCAPFDRAEQEMEELANLTGGRVLEAESGSRDLTFGQILEDLRSLYLLCYVSNNPGDTGYRKIQVTVNRRDLRVSSRSGYYPSRGSDRAASRAGDAPVLAAAAAKKPDQIGRPALQLPGSSNPGPSGSQAPPLGDPIPAGAPQPATEPPAAAVRVMAVNSARDAMPLVRRGWEMDVVRVPVTVRNGLGTMEDGLSRESFRIFENGQEQTVTSFAAPGSSVRLVLLADISRNGAFDWPQARRAILPFLKGLKPEDEFALATFESAAKLKMDWGRETEQLESVLDSIICYRNETRLWDAVDALSRDLLRKAPGRKVVILFSNGLDSDSTVVPQTAIDDAIRSRAAFYVVGRASGIDFSPLVSEDDALRGQKILAAAHDLERLASSTGGRVIHDEGAGWCDRLLSDVYYEIKNQYIVGYVPPSRICDGEYRHVSVAPVGGRFRVAFPPGYFASINADGCDLLGTRSVTMLPDRTPVFLRLAEAASSKWSPGELVRLEAVKDVVIDDLVIVRRGAYAWGTVESGTRPARMFRMGELRLSIQGIEAITGQRIPLNGIVDEIGDPILSVDPIVGPFIDVLGLVKGISAKLQKGRWLLAHVDGGIPFDTFLLDELNVAGKVDQSDRAAVFIYGTDYEPQLTVFGNDVTKKAMVRIDGEEVMKLPCNRYLALSVEPGRHSFASGNSTVELDLKPGDKVYLRISAFFRGRLVPVSEQEGEEELYPCERVDPKDLREPWKSQAERLEHEEKEFLPHTQKKK